MRVETIDDTQRGFDSRSTALKEIAELVKGYNPNYTPTLDDTHRITEWFSVIIKIQAISTALDSSPAER